MSRLLAVTGDITQETTDAIVNAANSSLTPGGGVCGAIHRTAGPELARACAELGGCPTGDVRITPGFALKAGHVIHAVGPVWHGGAKGEPDDLASCYRRSLELADEYGLRSIAFPAISTGIYSYPLDQATEIAVRTVRETIRTHPNMELVRFVCFTETDLHEYQRVLSETS
ncbi:MAG TPA: O-acetyl-ADP-ribose deacetylase [Gemmatimonadales bacterium]|nr:O-acetyl-ADP-ribose deacetylase [Gemmatimonadales bacterium]